MNISDKQFLVFFFRRLRLNNTGRYSQDFPFVSLCGRERNFVRCDDLPIVFTHVINKKTDESHEITDEQFCYAHAGELLTVINIFSSIFFFCIIERIIIEYFNRDFFFENSPFLQKLDNYASK